MKKLRIYLDTSVINFLFADDAPDFRQVTIDFFSRHALRFELFASSVVVAEIHRDPNPRHREMLLSVLTAHDVALLPDDHMEEIGELATSYIAAKVVPASKYEDALHVAYATVFGMDILLSWNFKHLANVMRETHFIGVNMRMGYRHPLRLLSPLEVEDEKE